MSTIADIIATHVEEIRQALNTEERGNALVEVARNAYKAEIELAAFKRRVRYEGMSLETAYKMLSQ